KSFAISSQGPSTSDPLGRSTLPSSETITVCFNGRFHSSVSAPIKINSSIVVNLCSICIPSSLIYYASSSPCIVLLQFPDHIHHDLQDCVSDLLSLVL